MVNGVVASTYIAGQDEAEVVTFKNGYQTFLSLHQAAHLISSPYRMLCLGIPGNDSWCHARDKSGIVEFAEFAIAFSQRMEEAPLLVQILAFPLLLALFGAAYAVELTFGAAFAPAAVMALAAFSWYYSFVKRTSKAKLD